MYFIGKPIVNANTDGIILIKFIIFFIAWVYGTVIIVFFIDVA